METKPTITMPARDFTKSLAGGFLLGLFIGFILGLAFNQDNLPDFRETTPRPGSEIPVDTLTRQQENIR